MTHVRTPLPVALVGVLALYLALAAGYALRTPAWQAPDEPAHYNYIAQTAARGCCPIIEAGDWDAGYLEALKASAFAPELLDGLDRVQYEDHQPPLYYLLLTPVFALTEGSPLALRLASAVIGAVTVVCAYASGRLALPGRPGAAAAVTLIVALLPQYLGIAASVNNDALAWALVGAALVALLRLVKVDVIVEGQGRFGGRVKPRSHKAAEGRGVDFLSSAVLLGLLAGLGLLTKVSTIFLLGLVPLGLWLAWRRSALPLRTLVLAWIAFAVVALGLASLWWLRNLHVYGAPDFLGLAAHDRVVVGQLRTETLIAQIGATAYLERALTTTFSSFFGQLGWMALPLPGWVYAAIALVLIVALAGWGLALRSRRAPSSASQRDQALVLAAASVLALLQYAYYNTEFVQFQGRYLFTGVIPFALAAAGGLASWPRPIGRWATWLPLALLPLNLWLIWRVVPGLAP